MSIFKSTIKPYLRRQIRAKQELLSLENRPPYFSKYVSSKSPWVRMVSFVDVAEGSVEPTDEMSKKYVLFGGTAYADTTDPNKYSYTLRQGINTPNAAYGSLGDKSKYGTRPMPGIEKVSIRSLSAYGSLKEATVTFYAWDKKQLEDLERLYMRPGYYVLLEWGWSTYLDTNGKVTSLKTDQETTSSIRDASISLTDNSIFKNMGSVKNDVFNPGITDDEIYKNLEELRFKYSGNYDGMLGCIRNFSWEFMPNGGYVCTTVLISAGEIIDSLKMSSVTTDSTNQLKQEGENEKYTPTQFEKIIDGLNDVSPSNIVQQKYKDYVKNLNNPDIQTDILRIKNGTLSVKDDTKSGYIQFAYLVFILSIEHNLFDDKESPIVDIEIPTYNNKNLGNGLCLASEDTVSVDPSKCIVQNNRAKFSCGRDDGFTVLSESGEPFKEFLLQDSSLGIIGNIYFNLLFVKSEYQKILQINKQVLLGDFIRKLLETASGLLGDINKFNLFVLDKKVAIIDVAYTEEPGSTRNDKKFLINLSGNNTIVRKSKIQSKIFHSQATMIAIAAQDRENVAAVNSSTNVAFNKGLKHRLKNFNVNVSDAKDAKNNTTSIKDEKQRLIDNIIVFQSYIKSMFDPTKHVDVVSSASSMASILNSIILNINVDANYRAVIPITLEIEVDGLGGFVIGEIFRVNQDILPTDYNSKNLGFIITQISNNITRADWTTTLTTQICLLDQDYLVKDAVKINKQEYGRLISEQLAKKSQMLYDSILAYNMLAAFISEFLRGDMDNYPMYVIGRYEKYTESQISNTPVQFDVLSPTFEEDISKILIKYRFITEKNVGVQLTDQITNKLNYIKNLALKYKSDDNIDFYITDLRTDQAIIMSTILSDYSYYGNFVPDIKAELSQKKSNVTDEWWLLLHQSFYYTADYYLPIYAKKGKLNREPSLEARDSRKKIVEIIKIIAYSSKLYNNMHSVVKNWFDQNLNKILVAIETNSSTYYDYTFPILTFGDDNFNSTTGEIKSQPTYYRKGINMKLGNNGELVNYYTPEEILYQKELEEQTRKSLIGVK